MPHRGDHRFDSSNSTIASGSTQRRWEFVPGDGGRSGPGIPEQPPTGSRPKKGETRVVAWQEKVQESDINPNKVQPDTEWISKDKEKLNKRKKSIQEGIQEQQKIINDIKKELD